MTDAAANYLSLHVCEEIHRHCASLLEPDADRYWRAVDVFACVSNALPDDAPGGLYLVWAFLTDRWELAPERRPEAEGLMVDAAREFIGVHDQAELDAYLRRWSARLNISS